MLNTLSDLLNNTLSEGVNAYILFKWGFKRTTSAAQDMATNQQMLKLTNETQPDLILSLQAQIECKETNLTSAVPMQIDITQKTGKSTLAQDLKIGDPTV